ncbi:E3 ubiquitin-protein ligase RNF220-like isoform X2 [Limulus polyphemus]|uniref:E3 ubiquitin-protein ligase RNF220-like isoform X2 n=1 Tax=Limulus polyphemus TaxID=6850 RepID=A0ABM1SDA7_LIMPO|nr:E3 ubiquitin-protein ligase RNF220-like isoform X2 [Limulus polyphemus]
MIFFKLVMEEATTKPNQQPTQDGRKQTTEVTSLQIRMGGLEAPPSIYSSANSPAFMVLSSQASDGGQQTQAMEKDPSSSFHPSFTSAGPFSALSIFGQTDTYSGFPSHFLPVSSPVMTSPGLEGQVSFLNSGTRSLEISGNRGVNGFHASAFIPAKCLKTDNSDLSTPHHSRYQDTITPPFLVPQNASTSSVYGKEFHSEDRSSSLVSPETHDRLNQTPVSDDADSTDRSTPEEGRLRRKVKKRGPLDGQASCCPVCGVTIRSGELLSHFEQEIGKLNKINKILRRPAREGTPQSRNSPSPGSSRRKGSPSFLDSRLEIFQKVQCNRRNRIGVRSCRTKKRTTDEVVCPVCCETLTGTTEELDSHVDRCLRKRENNGFEDETVDVERDENYEEYEWAGQTRIRATSLLQGGFAASGFKTRKCNNEDDVDQDLNVDSDDTATYGKPQYTEADILQHTMENRERQDLTRAIDSEDQQRLLEERRCVLKDDNEILEKQNELPSLTIGGNEPGKCTLETGKLQTISSLKARIRELEKQYQHIEKMKCLICMEPYTHPVVSVCCWHVYCEECWLRTLGAKKLCPQCNIITSPNDLRRIYL